MVRCFAFFVVVVCIHNVCLSVSQSEPDGSHEAASCGCEKLKRSAAVDTADPAVRYSRAANERLFEAQGGENKFQSQVILPVGYVRACCDGGREGRVSRVELRNDLSFLQYSVNVQINTCNEVSLRENSHFSVLNCSCTCY